MSSFAIVRELTSEDEARIIKAAESFCKRHNLRFNNEFYGRNDAENAIDYYCYSNNDKYSKRLWLKCFCRAVGIAYDSRVTTHGKYLAVRCE